MAKSIQTDQPPLPSDTPAAKKKRGRNVSPLLKTDVGSPPGADPGRTNEKVLVNRKVVDSILLQMKQRSAGTEPTNVPLLTISPKHQQMLDSLLGVEPSRAYYYRLAFSVAYRAYELHVQLTYIADHNINVSEDTAPLPRVRFREFSEASGINRYALPRLFVGKATNEALLKLVHFFRRHAISFEAILYVPSLIERAYTYHLLIENGLDPSGQTDTGLQF